MEETWSGLGDYAYIAAVFIPIIVGLLAKASTPSWAKVLGAIVLSAAVGAVTIWQTTGNWEWSIPFMLSIFGAAEVVYRLVIKNIPGASDWLASHLRSDSTP
jgi:hypothetical protein